MSEELLLCPFCGGEAEIREKYMSPTMNGKSTLISVEVRHWCPKVEGQPTCLNVTQIGRDRESAIKAWNTRANQPDLDEIVRLIEGTKQKLQHSTYEPATMEDRAYVTGVNETADKAIAIIRKAQGVEE